MKWVQLQIAARVENYVDIVYILWVCNHNNGADKQLIGIFTDAIKAKTCIEDFNKKDKFKDNNNPKYLKVEPYVLNKLFMQDNDLVNHCLKSTKYGLYF